MNLTLEALAQDCEVYVNRLTEEWKTHGKIVLSIDFDDTICPWKLRNQEQCDKTIRLIADCQQVGTYNVIFTACKKDRFPEILHYCEQKGIRVDAINENPINLPYGNDRKIYYNHNLCDRSGLPIAEYILAEAMYKQRAHNYSSVHRDEIG